VNLSFPIWSFPNNTTAVQACRDAFTLPLLSFFFKGSHSAYFTHDYNSEKKKKKRSPSAHLGAKHVYRGQVVLQGNRRARFFLLFLPSPDCVRERVRVDEGEWGLGGKHVRRSCRCQLAGGIARNPTHTATQVPPLFPSKTHTPHMRLAFAFAHAAASANAIRHTLHIAFSTPTHMQTDIAILHYPLYTLLLLFVSLLLASRLSHLKDDI
jgi:hypothetical protein